MIQNKNVSVNCKTNSKQIYLGQFVQAYSNYTLNKMNRVSNSVLIKKRVVTFLNNNRDITLAINRVFNFVQKYRISVHKSLEDYNDGNYTWKRLLLVSLARLMVLMTFVRYISSAMISKKWIIILMSDANHVLGNQRLISFVISIACFVAFCIGIIVQFKEMSKTNELFQFMYDFKHKRIIPLNDKHSKRITLIMNMMAKYLMEQAFWPLVITCLGTLFATSVVAYFDQDSNYSLISILLWNSITPVVIIQICGIVWIGCVVSVLSSLYLKYKFEEINEEIKSCIKFKNNNRLKKAIADHNYICDKTSYLNDFFSHMSFQLYHIGTPALMGLLFLTHAKDTVFMARFVAVFIFVLVFSVVFFATLLYSQISRSSRKPKDLIYSQLFLRKYSVEESLKLMAFVEKLMGPDIGFYCWNLFPLNSYQFYKYVASCACSYFLIMEMI